MSGQYDATPGPVPMAAMSDRATTGSIVIPHYMTVPPPPPPPAHFGEWWKQLVAVCAGLATVGIIIWAVGKQFFVTREEWVEIRDAVRLSASKAEQTEHTFQDLRVTIEKLQESTAAISMKLILIEAQTRRR